MVPPSRNSAAITVSADPLRGLPFPTRVTDVARGLALINQAELRSLFGVIRFGRSCGTTPRYARSSGLSLGNMLIFMGAFRLSCPAFGG